MKAEDVTVTMSDDPNLVYGAVAQDFLRSLPAELRPSVAAMLSAAIVAGQTATTRGNAALQKGQAEKIRALAKEAHLLHPDVAAHPCGYLVEDDHNAHYAGACPCYGYG